MDQLIVQIVALIDLPLIEVQDQELYRQLQVDPVQHIKVHLLREEVLEVHIEVPVAVATGVQEVYQEARVVQEVVQEAQVVQEVFPEVRVVRVDHPAVHPEEAVPDQVVVEDKLQLTN